VGSQSTGPRQLCARLHLCMGPAAEPEKKFGEDKCIHREILEYLDSKRYHANAHTPALGIPPPPPCLRISVGPTTFPCYSFSAFVFIWKLTQEHSHFEIAALRSF